MRRVAVVFVGLLLALSVGALPQYYEGLQDPKIYDLGSDEYPGLEPGVCGGTLYVSGQNPRKWNSVTSHEQSTFRFTNLFLRGLQTIHPQTAALEPDLCAGWEISEDSLEITFYLRRGVRWSDGVEFTSADVLFTYNDLILNDDVESSAQAARRLPNGTYPVMTAPDPYTVRIEVSMVFRPILYAFNFNIMPKHVLGDSVHKLNPQVPRGHFNGVWGLDTPPEELVGIGPFLVESYMADQHVTMVRNPYYYGYDQHGTQLPYVDRVVMLVTGSHDATLLKFLNRELDAIGLEAEDLPVLTPKAAEEGFEVWVGALTYTNYWMAFNQDYGLGEGKPEKDQLRGLFRDIRFRKAIAHAIDKQTFIDNVRYGLGTPAWSMTSIPSPFYAGRDCYACPITEADAVIYEYNLDRSAALLDEIGLLDTDGDGWREFPDGRPVEFLFEMAAREGSEVHHFGLILADDLEKVGIRMNLGPTTFDTLATRLFASTYQAAVLGLGGGDDPHFAANVYATYGDLHFWHYSAATDPYPCEERIDELYELGVSTLDNDEAFAYYKEMQILQATEDLGLIFLITPNVLDAAYRFIGNRQIVEAGYTAPGSSDGVSTHLYWLEEPVRSSRM